MQTVKTKISDLKPGDKWGRYTCKRQSDEGMHYVRNDGEMGLVHGCIGSYTKNYDWEVDKILNSK